MIEAYFVSRSPERRLEFINLGLPSETVLPLAEAQNKAGELDRQIRAHAATMPEANSETAVRPAKPRAGPIDADGRPLIRKLGTIDLDLVETTPIVLYG